MQPLAIPTLPSPRSRIHGGRVYSYSADSHEKAQQRGRHDIAHLVDQLSVRPREESIESGARFGATYYAAAAAAAAGAAAGGAAGVGGVV